MAWISTPRRPGASPRCLVSHPEHFRVQAVAPRGLVASRDGAWAGRRAASCGSRPPEPDSATSSSHEMSAAHASPPTSRLAVRRRTAVRQRAHSALPRVPAGTAWDEAAASRPGNLRLPRAIGRHRRDRAEIREFRPRGDSPHTLAQNLSASHSSCPPAPHRCRVCAPARTHLQRVRAASACLSAPKAAPVVRARPAQTGFTRALPLEARACATRSARRPGSGITPIGRGHLARDFHVHAVCVLRAFVAAVPCAAVPCLCGRRTARALLEHTRAASALARCQDPCPVRGFPLARPACHSFFRAVSGLHAACRAWRPRPFERGLARSRARRALCRPPVDPPTDPPHTSQPSHVNGSRAAAAPPRDARSELRRGFEVGGGTTARLRRVAMGRLGA